MRAWGRRLLRAGRAARALLPGDELVEIVAERDLRAGDGTGRCADDQTHRPRVEAGVLAEAGHDSDLPRDADDTAATEDESDVHGAPFSGAILPRREVGRTADPRPTTTTGSRMTPEQRDDLETVIGDSPARVLPESAHVIRVEAGASLGDGDLAILHDDTDTTLVTTAADRRATAERAGQPFEGPFTVIRLEISRSFQAPGFIAAATGACATAGITRRKPGPGTDATSYRVRGPEPAEAA